jgi:hypothetical protein
MIGRIAEVKYFNTENDHLSIAEKCTMVLDLILPSYGVTRREVKLKEDSDSESDEDY